MKKRSGLNVLKGHAWLAMSVAVLAFGLSNEQMVNAEETESAATSNVEEAANQDSNTSSNDATSGTEVGEEANSDSGTATQALLPSQVRNMDSSSKEEVTVEGYIAGTMKSPTSVATSNFDNSNIALADTYVEGGEVDASRVLPIQLPSGTLRDTYNLVDNPELLGKKVRMTGRLDKYFGGTGIKDRAATIEVIADADNQTPATDNPTVELPVANESNLTINQVRNSETGTTVATSGKIISPINAWGGQGFYIQDSAGDGIFVYPRTALGYKMGDTIQLTGTLSEYNKELQIIDITAHEQVKDVQVPEPTATTITAVNDGQNAAQMGTLITLSNVTVGTIISDSYGTSTFTVTTSNEEDATEQTLQVRVDNRSGVTNDKLEEKIGNGDVINLTGILSQYGDTLQIKPFTLDHFQVVKKAEPSQVSEETYLIGQIQGESHRSPFTGQMVKLQEAVVTYVASDSKFYIQDITPDDNPKTSNGIEVFSRNHNVKVGDKVSVQGLVVEFYGDGYSDKQQTDLTITQISNAKIEVTGTSDVPKPIILGEDIPLPTGAISSDGFSEYNPELYTIDFWESLEGMLVAVRDPRVIGPQLYKEIYVLPAAYDGKLNNAYGLTLQPDSDNPSKIPLLLKNNLVAKSGDYFIGLVDGPVSYSYGNYKVLIDNAILPPIQDGGLKPEVTELKAGEKELSIASYNIENFSANASSTSNEKVARIARSIVMDLNQPDIITLVEMQDNNGTDNNGVVEADKSAQRLIDAIVAAGGVRYEYVDIAPENNQDGGAPGGNIRNGFLYNPNRVQLSDKPKAAANENLTWNNGELSHSIGRVDPTNSVFKSTRKPVVAEFEFLGNKVHVMAVHLNSKRGDSTLYGQVQPAVLGSEPKRHEMAEIIAKFLDEGYAQNNDLNVAILGDFNDFEFTQTMALIEGDNRFNLVSQHDEADRYSYFYRGNFQSLDNIVLSNNLRDRYQFDMVHVNSAFMSQHGRASDHDPLLVVLNFDDTKVEESNESEEKNETSSSTGETPTTPSTGETPTTPITGEDKPTTPPTGETPTSPTTGEDKPTPPTGAVTVLLTTSEVKPTTSNTSTVGQNEETNSDTNVTSSTESDTDTLASSDDKQETSSEKDDNKATQDGTTPESQPTTQTSKAHTTTLPETGEVHDYAIFTSATLAILASVGLIYSKKEEME